jgi:hypothetical protein
MTIPALTDVLAQIEAAGGFGDGVDFGSFRPLDALTDPGISSDDRESATLVLLCELAESVDNATWKEAVASALGRRLRQFLGSSGVITHESAIQAFFADESAFFAELNSVYAKVVGK